MVFGFYRRGIIYILWLLIFPRKPLLLLFFFQKSKLILLLLSLDVCGFLPYGHINGQEKFLRQKSLEWVSNYMIGGFKDPTYVLMRVLLCKIQCPSFICFCKPSPHIYAAGSLKLENTPQVSSSTTVVDDHDHYDDARVEKGVDHVDGLLNEAREEDCAIEEQKEEEEGHCNGEILKSSLKKAVLDSADGGSIEKKKKVQWVDLMGKELAEIREFESSEEEDMRYDGHQSCVCVIL